MDAADPQGYPPDRDGGSLSSAPSLDRGSGSSSTPPAARSQPEVIEVDGNKAVLAITPALVHDRSLLPADIVKAVDDFKVPEGYRKEGCRERSFMYSLGVYVVPLAEEDHKHEYFCTADPSCRKNKATAPCKKGRPKQCEHPPQEQTQGARSGWRCEGWKAQTSEREHPAELRGEQEFLCWNEQVCVC